MLRSSHPGRGLALIPAAIGVLAALNLAIPYYSLSPGPAEDVKGLIHVAGAKTYPVTGKLLLTTVSLRSVRLSDAILGWFDPVVDVIPRGDIVPRGKTEQEVDKVNADQMEQSKSAAAAAALSMLGYPVHERGGGARIDAVMPQSKGQGLLRKGDVITGLDGQTVTSGDDLVARLQRHHPGDNVAIRLMRSGKPLDVIVQTIASQDGRRAIIGIQVQEAAGTIDLPLDVEIKSGGIGGPSAGLMFAVGIVDLLESGDLTQGRVIAGTGVISSSGDVSPVGGVQQKVAAAERAGAVLFLVPRAELKDARHAARHIRVSGVVTLRDAIQALRDLHAPVQASSPSSSPAT